MPRVLKVPPAELLAFLEEGHSQKEAAEHFGASEYAISQARKRLERAVVRKTAVSEAGRQVIRQQVITLDAILVQVSGIADQARGFLDLINAAMADDGQGVSVEDRSRAYAARAKLARLAGSKGMGGFLSSQMDQLRKALKFIFNMYKEIYNVKKVEEFQRVVLEEIKALEPEAAQRIVARLIELDAVRSATDAGLDSA